MIFSSVPSSYRVAKQMKKYIDLRSHTLVLYISISFVVNKGLFKGAKLCFITCLHIIVNNEAYECKFCSSIQTLDCTITCNIVTLLLCYYWPDIHHKSHEITGCMLFILYKIMLSYENK